MISFLLNDKAVQISDARADTTVLNYLRDNRRLTGTKEGCASGDCGACSVVLVELGEQGQTLHYKALNSCVTFLSALQGKQLLTVEHLAQGETLHPVQAAMVDKHGSQCGFCTPGFVMSMFALYQQNSYPGPEDVNVALGGNLCRCTGYRPIIDAALACCSDVADDQFVRRQSQTITQLHQLKDDKPGLHGLQMPQNRAQLAQARQAFPAARLFAGSTDLALEVTQQLKNLDNLICLTQVTELQQIIERPDSLEIGAAISFGKCEPLLLKHFPELREMITRFAATPIRNQATLGGNVANASPIGDMPPVLLALNAQFQLDNGRQRRQIPAQQFFTGYRQTMLGADEWLEAIIIPHAAKNSQLRAYKVSKRHEDDISAVCAVFNVQLTQGKVQHIQTGFGGVAATPVSAPGLSSALTGLDWASSATFERGKAIISQAFTPIDDVRATAHYRQSVLVNLWKRFWLQTNQQSQKIETRVHAYE
ncbi:MAG: xanthine dehydrogenase small subunit [Paraglaciecola sp.]|jgi:xanthine dehydrogenase small subunit